MCRKGPWGGLPVNLSEILCVVCLDGPCGVCCQETCGKGGSAECLQEGVGKVVECLAAGEKALARPGGRRKPQEVPDPDNEWKPLRVSCIGMSPFLSLFSLLSLSSLLFPFCLSFSFPSWPHYSPLCLPLCLPFTTTQFSVRLSYHPPCKTSQKDRPCSSSPRICKCADCF